MKKVLFVGVLGFHAIGRSVVEHVARNGHQIHLVSMPIIDPFQYSKINIKSVLNDKDPVQVIEKTPSKFISKPKNNFKRK